MFPGAELLTGMMGGTVPGVAPGGLGLSNTNESSAHTGPVSVSVSGFNPFDAKKDSPMNSAGGMLLFGAIIIGGVWYVTKKGQK